VSSTPWFIATPDAWTDSEVTLPADESHHALKVMRVTPPDVIVVTDGHGRVARCAASRVTDGALIAEILAVEERRPVKPQIVVYQGAAKGSKVDSIVERLAELGVAEVWVYESSRSVVKWGEAKVAKLGERWRAIARSAAKQSRSPFILETGGGMSWTELLRRVAKEPHTVVLWEEASFPLRTALVGTTDRVALVVGPEGGLDRSEAESLADAGAQLVSLGPQILRTENAAVVTTAALQFHYGLLG
jgi:16S rRNA (uracil1498-N3)-methyltransferase